MTEIDQNTVTTTRKIISIVVPCIVGWCLTFLATNVFRDYAVGLFLWLPAVMGATSTILLAFENRADKKLLRNISFITLGVFFLGMLTFAWEGIICMIMAAPLGLLFISLG